MNNNIHNPNVDLKNALLLKEMIFAVIQQSDFDEIAYLHVRNLFVSNSRTSNYVPQIVRSCYSKSDLIAKLCNVASGSGSWQERRIYVQNQFEPFLNHLEYAPTTLSEDSILEVIKSGNMQIVNELWGRAVERINTDPEGAITLSRTLIETVCKRILDKQEISYAENLELPKLYKLTSESLNLGPSQHTEDVFKRILGGCHTIVENLGSLRNKVGDAHGTGANRIRPVKRHARFAVNLAGSTALFLLETYDSKQTK